MGEWLSLMEYATHNSVSLSTLRRQIKSGKLTHRLEAGRYLIWNENTGSMNSTVAAPAAARMPAPAPASSSSSAQIAELEMKLKKAREEIVELKTLLAFYEEQSPQSGLSV